MDCMPLPDLQFAQCVPCLSSLPASHVVLWLFCNAQIGQLVYNKSLPEIARSYHEDLLAQAPSQLLRLLQHTLPFGLLYTTDKSAGGVRAKYQKDFDNCKVIWPSWNCKHSLNVPPKLASAL